MLNRKHAEAASDALLTPAREAQQVAQQQKEDRHLRRIAHQRLAPFGLGGMVLGCAIGYTFFDGIMPAGILGLGIGFVVGRIITHRVAQQFNQPGNT